MQYRRRGRVLEVRLRDVSLDRVFNHAWSNYKKCEILSKFADVTHLTIFAFDWHQEKDTEAYLSALSQLLNTGEVFLYISITTRLYCREVVGTFLGHI